MSEMKRREFLERTGKATALAAIVGGAGWLFNNRNIALYEPAVAKTQDFGVSTDKALPEIVLAKNEDHVRALKAALDGIGGIKRFVKPGEKVTVKPNVGWDRTAEQAADTNPLLVGAMVSLCFEAGATEVIVSDVTCNDPRRCFLRSGIRKAAEEAGAKVLLAEEDDFITVDIEGKLLTKWPVLKHFVETDRLINRPIVKQHSLSECTIAMKNLYGILGGSRHRLHQEIDQSIVDLAAFARPTLTVVDATRVLMRSGPQGGSLEDVNVENSVICATDQVAADARGAEFLGLRAENVRHIVLAEETGLGKINYRDAGYREVS